MQWKETEDELSVMWSLFCLCWNVDWRIGLDRAKGRKRHYKHRNIETCLFYLNLTQIYSFLAGLFNCHVSTTYVSAVKFYCYVVSFQIQILLTRSEVCSKTRLESCSHSSFSFASFWVYQWWLQSFLSGRKNYSGKMCNCNFV